MGEASNYFPFGIFVETRKENETFKKYYDGGSGCDHDMILHLSMCGDLSMTLNIVVIDLSNGGMKPAEPIRAEQGWTIGELKQNIGDVRG